MASMLNRIDFPGMATMIGELPGATRDLLRRFADNAQDKAELAEYRVNMRHYPHRSIASVTGDLGAIRNILTFRGAYLDALFQQGWPQFLGPARFPSVALPEDDKRTIPQFRTDADESDRRFMHMQRWTTPMQGRFATFMTLSMKEGHDSRWWVIDADLEMKESGHFGYYPLQSIEGDQLSFIERAKASVPTRLRHNKLSTLGTKAERKFSRTALENILGSLAVPRLSVGDVFDLHDTPEDRRYKGLKVNYFIRCSDGRDRFSATPYYDITSPNDVQIGTRLKPEEILLPVVESHPMNRIARSVSTGNRIFWPYNYTGVFEPTLRMMVLCYVNDGHLNILNYGGYWNLAEEPINKHKFLLSQSQVKKAFVPSDHPQHHAVSAHKLKAAAEYAAVAAQRIVGELSHAAPAWMETQRV